MEFEKNKYIIDSRSTIAEAWSVIEANRHRSVLIVENKKVLGVASDGDLRKAMLSRLLLSTPVLEIMNTNFIYLKNNEREKSGNIFKDKDIFIIPVVDVNMKLLDIIVRC